MSNVKSTDTLVALDIGTSKVLCLVADIDDKGDLRIIGIGNEPCNGLNKGIISEIDATVSSITEMPKKKPAQCLRAIFSLLPQESQEIIYRVITAMVL